MKNTKLKIDFEDFKVLCNFCTFFNDFCMNTLYSNESPNIPNDMWDGSKLKLMT